MKRILAILLCAVLALGCFSLAAAEGEKDHLTIWIPMDLRIEDYETNWMTQWLEEQGNFDLEFIPQPSGSDYTTKVNVALTAGSIDDLPDIIMEGMDDNKVYNWALEGTIIPLTEYYNNPELAVNINEAKERTGVDFTKMITSPDGEIYGFAKLNQSYYNEHSAKMFIYTPWMEKLNLKTPTTTDELYEVLKAIATGDPNGNGKADEIALTGTFGKTTMFDNWFEFIMNAFVYAGKDGYISVDDGVVSLSYTKDEWREGLRYIKKLYDEGLLQPEALTQDTQACDTIFNTEEVTSFTVPYSAPDRVNNTEIEVGYDYLLPITGPNGLRVASFNPSTASIAMVVTANCKNPEAAFRLGDLMSSEVIGISQRFGAQGIDWDYAADVDTAGLITSIPDTEMSIVTYHDGEFWGGSAVGNGSYRQKGAMIRQYWVANGWAVNPETVDEPALKIAKAAVAFQTGGLNPAETFPKILYTEEESDLVTEIASDLKNYVWETSAAFIVGTQDLDADWDAFQEELKVIGVETYQEVLQNVYDRMYK